jgi:hypothetical protein
MRGNSRVRFLGGWGQATDPGYPRVGRTHHMAKGDRWSDDPDVKVREMRNAETVLGVISERGRRRLPLEDIYRQLFNRDLFLRAYGRIYRNDGAMTPGATPETVDAMSLEKIDAIIGVLRQERYRWTPVRRMYIPKKSGKLRPLGILALSQKLGSS